MKSGFERKNPTIVGHIVEFKINFPYDWYRHLDHIERIEFIRDVVTVWTKDSGFELTHEMFQDFGIISQ